MGTWIVWSQKSIYTDGKFKYQKTVYFDNWVLKVHFLTALLLLLFLMIMTYEDYFGKPIYCNVDNCYNCGHMPDNYLKVVNNYCHIMRTYTIPKEYQFLGAESQKKIQNYNTLDLEKDALDEAHPGINLPTNNSRERIYYKYYQWICFFLMFQAGLFLFPFYFWKYLSTQFISDILCGSYNRPKDIDEKNYRLIVIANQFIRRLNEDWRYFIYLVLCELLNFAMVISQLYCTNKFFNGALMEHGLKLFSLYYTEEYERDDYIRYIFPKVTKCTFESYGASKLIKREDAYCVLPMNYMAEKIYIFTWFLLWILFAIGIVNLILRLTFYLFPCFRPYLYSDSIKSINLLFPEQVNRAVRKLSVFDWWKLTVIGENLDRAQFFKLFEDISSKI